VTRKIRGYCTMFAAQGYLAIAPDLFWRMDRGVQLGHDEEGMRRALGYLQQYDAAAGLEDIRACAEHLRAQGAGKIAVTGYCLGGKLAALAAARGDADAAVSFYPVGLEQSLDALRGLRVPLQLHFGAQDTYIPAAAIEQIEVAVAGAPGMELHRYAEAGHAFFRPDLKGDASATAWKRTLAFLDAHLSCSRNSASPPGAGEG